MLDIYVGRQPIFDRNRRVHAYELVFRRSRDAAEAGDIDGDLATSRVLMNTFMEFGLEHIVGEHTAFVNVTRSFLLGDFSMPLPKDRVVLEVLEDIKVDASLVSAAQRLAADGYRLALDDFVYHPDYEPLLDIASFIKLDVRALDDTQLADHVARLQGRPAKLLAEKVETQEQFDRCCELGFELYQGFYFARPQTVTGRRVPANRLAGLQLLGALNDDSTSIGELEQIIQRDVSLSYKILRYLNSGHFALRNRVESLHQAIVMLGVETIRNWATLIVLAGFDDAQSELCTAAMVRARMSQLIGKATGNDPAMCFTAGLFSLLDTMLGTPMDQVLAQLPLAESLSVALREHAGPIGSILETVIAYEDADLDRLAMAEGTGDVSLREVYLEAVQWAGKTADHIAA